MGGGEKAIYFYGLGAVFPRHPHLLYSTFPKGKYKIQLCTVNYYCTVLLSIVCWTQYAVPKQNFTILYCTV